MLSSYRQKSGGQRLDHRRSPSYTVNDRTIHNDKPSSPDESVSVTTRDGTLIMSVRCDTGSLRQLRRELDHELASVMEPTRRAEFLVAVNEAVTNAIESQQRNDVWVPIIVTIDRPNRLLTIDDHAPASSDIPEIPEGMLPPPSTFRGRGMHIMRAICPEVQIVSTDVGCSVVFPLT